MNLPRGVFAVLLLVFASVQAETFSGSARVLDDGRLRVAKRTVNLWGIYIPETRTNCSRWQRPPRCGSRAALALEFKINGFVRCTAYERITPREVSANCYVNHSSFDEGDDLAAYLLNRGWAVAMPDAPIEYHVLERVARETGLGIWGLPGVLQP